jgi:hypothetical protein
VGWQKRLNFLHPLTHIKQRQWHRKKAQMLVICLRYVYAACRCKEHLLSGSENSMNLKVLTVKGGTLNLQNKKTNHSGEAKKWTRKARLAAAPAGDSAGSQPQQGPLNQGPSFKGARLRNYRGLVHLGLRPKEVTDKRSRGPVHLGSSLGDVANFCGVLICARDPLEAHLRGRRQRGPRRLGN